MKGGFNNVQIQNGFSTLELMIAFTIMTIALIGAVDANFGAEYWSLTARMSSEALYTTKTNLENLEMLARQDFFQATSSPLATVTDISSCAKNIDAYTSWHIPNYPTSTVSLVTSVTNQTEAVALGGDCLVTAPKGDWVHMTASGTADVITGTPTGIDVLNGVAYITLLQPPYLVTIASSTSVGCTGCSGPYNALDVARDTTTNRTYAYIAATTTRQFQIVDVTDVAHPTLVASTSLSGVVALGADSQAWRVAYYDQKAYVTTRSITGPQPEFHIFDVHDPTTPIEIGSVNLNTSVYSMIIRKQHSVFAYLATTHDQKEIEILDVTNPASVPAPTVINLPDDPACVSNEPDAKALALLGNTLYVGREYSLGVCSSLPELYALDVTDPTHGVAIQTQKEVGEHVLSLRASGQYLFAGTSRQGKESLQVWRNDPSNLTVLASTTLDNLIENGIDLDRDFLYAVSSSHPAIHIFSAP